MRKITPLFLISLSQLSNAKLERWWGGLESKCLTIRRTKKKYMNCNFIRDVHRAKINVRIEAQEIAAKSTVNVFNSTRDRLNQG